MIPRDLAPAIVHCFLMLYRAEQRGKVHEAETWKLGILALLEGDGRRVA